MAGLYIFIILLLRVVQALFNKRSSIEIKSITTLIGYNAYRNAISALLGLSLIVFASNGFKINWPTVCIAFLSGLSLFCSGSCNIYAMKSGTVSLNSMFGTAGMIIPIVAGTFLFDQPISLFQLVGLAVFFVAAYLLVSASKAVYSNFSYKTLLLLIGSMVSNGCTMLTQQLFVQYVPDGDVSVFSFLSFGLIAILSTTVYGVLGSAKKQQKESTRMSRPLMLCGVALAVAVFAINQLATLSAALVPPVILFTFINGGGTIISTLTAAIVYKEKLCKKTAWGIVLGIASLVIIKAFA